MKNWMWIVLVLIVVSFIVMYMKQNKKIKQLMAQDKLIDADVNDLIDSGTGMTSAEVEMNNEV